MVSLRMHNKNKSMIEAVRSQLWDAAQIHTHTCTRMACTTADSSQRHTLSFGALMKALSISSWLSVHSHRGVLQILNTFKP